MKTLLHKLEWALLIASAVYPLARFAFGVAKI